MDPNQPFNPQPPFQPGPQPGMPPQPPAPAQMPGPLPGQQAPEMPAWQPPAPQHQPYNQPPVQQAPNPQPGYHDVPPTFGNHYGPPTQRNNKKKLIIIGIATAVVLAVGAFFLFGGAKSVVNKISGVELQKYSNTTFAFSMEIPKGWETEEENEEFIKQVTFDEPAGDVGKENKYYAYIKVDYEFADQDYLEKDESKYFETIKKGIQRALSEQGSEDEANYESYTPEVASLESEEMITVNGLKAYKVKLKITNFDGDKNNIGYEWGMFVFADSKNQYEITVRAHESEDVNGKVDSILASFAKQ